MTSGSPGNYAWRHGLVSNKISWWSDLCLTTGSMEEHEFWLKEWNDQKISPSICYGRFCWFFADLWTLSQEIDVSNPRVIDPFQAEREHFFQSPWQQFENFTNQNNLQWFLCQDLSIEPYMKVLGPGYQKLQPFPEPDFIKEIFIHS